MKQLLKGSEANRPSGGLPKQRENKVYKGEPPSVTGDDRHKIKLIKCEPLEWFQFKEEVPLGRTPLDDTRFSQSRASGPSVLSSFKFGDQIYSTLSPNC